MKVKLTTFNDRVTPDIELRDAETGEAVQNRDLKKEDVIEARITYADPDEKLTYLGTRYETEIGSKRRRTRNRDVSTSYSEFRIEECIRKHVQEITGCISEHYRDGNSLMDGEPSAERNDLIMDLFYRINGIRLDDDPFEDGGAGPLSEGESRASG